MGIDAGGIEGLQHDTAHTLPFTVRDSKRKMLNG